jgi:hypothetical protein
MYIFHLYIYRESVYSTCRYLCKIPSIHHVAKICPKEIKYEPLPTNVEKTYSNYTSSL